jgi:hypothetical protein
LLGAFRPPLAAHAIRQRLGHLYEAADQIGVAAGLPEVVVQQRVFVLPHGIAIPIGLAQIPVIGGQHARALLERHRRIVLFRRLEGRLRGLRQRAVQQVAVVQEVRVLRAHVVELPAMRDAALHVEQQGGVSADRRAERITLESVSRVVESQTGLAEQRPAHDRCLAILAQDCARGVEPMQPMNVPMLSLAAGVLPEFPPEVIVAAAAAAGYPARATCWS